MASTSASNPLATLSLLDVLSIPSIQRNLISISKLDRDGYYCTFGNNICAISCEGDTVVMHLYMMSFIYCP